MTGPNSSDSGGPFGPTHPDYDSDGVCWGFAWVGQALSSCDVCGDPFWEHKYDAAFDRGQGFYRREIPEKTKLAMRKARGLA